MTGGFRRYPEYRDSGVEWLGEIPAHWEVVELGRVGQFFKGKGGSKLDEKGQGVPCVRHGDLSTYHDHHIVDTRSYLDEQVAAAYTPISCGDVLFAASGETIEEVGTSAVNLIQSAAVCGGDVIVFRPEDNWDPCFLGYALGSVNASQQESTMGRGFTIAHIYISQLRRLRTLLLPLPEQRAIANYLDRQMDAIDRLVRKKERLIELLNEARESLISQAVTRGLDPEAPTRDSGVEWLGEIPAHWEVVELGRVGQFFKGKGGSKLDEKGQGVPCVRHGDLSTYHDHHIVDTRSYLDEHVAAAYTPISCGDVLFAASGETIEEIGTSAVNLIQSAAVCGGDVIVFRPEDNWDPCFLGYALGSVNASQQKSTMGRGFTIAHIYISQLRRLRTLLLPLPEQRAIADFLDRETGRIDAMVAKTREAIERLCEYRGSLISAAVTGQIDVRESMASP